MECCHLSDFEQRSVIPVLGIGAVRLAFMRQLPTGYEGDGTGDTGTVMDAFSDCMPTALRAKPEEPPRTSADKTRDELIADELDAKYKESQERAAREDRGKNGDI